ncbi:MAG: SIS domain-containing protein [Methylocystis sp.]|nr:SIS domain-containing protein [Methylocystis sp.]MCA3588869.1 SIS domain-containing protein [Methylocystis sp.]MCA3592950.1 SIS domain-containing protein [Methylocystis sp.]
MTETPADFKAIKREFSSDAAGDPERFRRVELTRQEMMAQGDAMRETFQSIAEPVARIASDMTNRPLDRVIIVGCGDSWISGIGVRLAMERLLGVPVEAVEAFDMENYGLPITGKGTLVIGISSSGKTSPVTASITGVRQHGGYAVAVTNTPMAPMIADADAFLLIKATRGGWPTQASTACMAALIEMAAAIAAARGRHEGKAPGIRAALHAMPAAMDAVAKAFWSPTEALAAILAKVDYMQLAGAGPHFAPAAFGSAKLRELAPIHASAFPLEEYHHYRTQKDGDVMFLIAPDQASRQRALETAIVSKGVGGYTIALVPEGEMAFATHVQHVWHLPPVRDDLAPLLYSVPLHLFSYHVTKARDALGLGAPRLGL